MNRALARTGLGAAALLWGASCTTAYRSGGGPVTVAAPSETAPRMDAPLMQPMEVPVQQPAAPTAVPAPSASPAPAIIERPGPSPSVVYGSQDATRDFERAEALLKAGSEDQALISYTDFLRRYPGHARQDDAQYAIAEIFFRKRNYAQALKEYRKIYRTPESSSDRWPDATLRSGDCLAKLGLNAQARVEWSAVVRRFPRSEAARAASAQLAGQGSGS